MANTSSSVPLRRSSGETSASRSSEPISENIHRDAPVDFVGEGNLAHELQDIFHERTLADWMDVALGADVAMGPANQRADLLDDPQLKSRRVILETEHPHAVLFTTIGWPAW